MSKKLIYLMSVVLVLALAGTNVALGEVWEGRVIDDTDDTEELDPSGTPEAGSGDLEFPYEDAGMGDKQLVAIRWQDVGVPKGATIVAAWIEFTVDEIEEDLHVSVIIEGELNPNPPTFTESTPFEIADRQPRTAAQAIYEPEHWPTEGAKHQTSDISPVIQEIVNQDGWESGNALVLIIRDNPANPSKGNRTAEADAGGADIATLLHIEYTLGKAAGPSPADGAIDVSRDVVLSWTPGVSAALINGHKVYFSESFDDVSNGIGAITQSDSSYAPGRLEFGTTYYWRVDEVNNVNPGSPWISNVWSFTTELLAYPVENITATASSTDQEGLGPENTINGSGLDVNDLHSMEDTGMWLSSDEPNGWIEYELDKVYKLHEMWVWNSNGMLEYLVGFGLKDVTIEYSTNGTDYMTLGTTHEFVRAPSADGYAHDTTVDFGGVPAKYVRLTANSNWGGVMNKYGLSEVRFFSIPIFAKEPSPDSGTTDVVLDVVLGWAAGREAETHDVYLSNDEQAVIDGNAPVNTVAETSFDPLSLDFGTTYYWKINEVNEAETTTTWQGDLWSFTTTDNLVVDDFEDYNDWPPNQIWATWVDGYGVPENGATAGYPDPLDFLAGEHYMETTIVHGGEQSMPLLYDNTGTATSSEATRTFAVPQDWTAANIHTLALYFHGMSGNTGQFYVKVNGSKVIYDGDAGNLARTGWQAWNIDLASFGTDLQSVTTLAIGIDDNGASGTLYFDDIRLYSYSRQFITPAEPDNAGLVGHWKFDEGAGTIALDSSGLGNDGTLGPEGDPQWVAGVKGGALDLDGIGDYVSIDGVADDITTNIFTLTAWFKTTQTAEGSLFATNSGSSHALQFGVKGGNVWVDDGLETQFPPAVNDDQWYFVAYVRDGTTAYIYVDGALRSTDEASDNPAGDTRWSIGQEWDPPVPSDEYEGMVDDVRFYNYALSLGEVAWLAGMIEPFDKPFPF